MRRAQPPQSGILVQHRRGHAAGDVCRRHGRGPALGDLPHPRAGQDCGENVELRARIADLNAALQRSDALLNLRDQRVIVWNNDNKKPELVGALPAESGAPDERAAFLAFGRWLMPRSAAALENAIAALREKGTAFDLVVETQTGAPLEVQGRKSAAHVIVRFVSLSETQRMQARLRMENQRLAADTRTFSA